MKELLGGAEEEKLPSSSVVVGSVGAVGTLVIMPSTAMVPLAPNDTIWSLMVWISGPGVIVVVSITRTSLLPVATKSGAKVTVTGSVGRTIGSVVVELEEYENDEPLGAAAASLANTMRANGFANAIAISLVTKRGKPKES